MSASRGTSTKTRIETKNIALREDIITNPDTGEIKVCSYFMRNFYR